MRDDLWYMFSQYVNIPESQSDEIKRKHSSERERKQAFIPHLITTHPALSWRRVANGLHRMGTMGGVSCHDALDHLQQLFPTGNIYFRTLYTTFVCR